MIVEFIRLIYVNFVEVIDEAGGQGVVIKQTRKYYKTRFRGERR
jgi:hypothetical protein